jgi:hypothetical protein
MEERLVFDDHWLGQRSPDYKLGPLGTARLA